MTVPVPKGFFTAVPRSNGEAKAGHDQQAAVVAELLGGSPPSTLTIANGRIVPTAAIHYVDTEGQAPLDDLERIATDHHPAGRLLLLLPADPGRAVAVQHDSLAAAEGPLLLRGEGVTLGPGCTSLLLLRIGDVWTEISRECAPPVPGRLRRISRFATSAIYTKESWLRVARVCVWGGGGGGGVGFAPSGTCGSGAAGGYAEKLLVDSEIAATVSVTIGAGGAGGSGAAPSAGAPGGTSSFGTHCSATGGGGGSSTAGAGAAGGAGGIGIGGDDVRTGGRGSNGSTLRVVIGGDAPKGGQGGRGIGTSGSGGGSQAGEAPGGGGASGITETGLGGDGAAGLVVVYEYE